MAAASLAPLRIPAFRSLFVGATASRLGSAIAPIALAFAVLDLHSSAIALGLVLGARSLATVVFLLLGGVIADRLPRAVVLVGSSLAAAATQGAVSAIIALRVDSLALLVALSAVNGAVAAFALPASAALIPQTIDATMLVPANALSRLGANAAAVVGTSAAGLIVATLGSAWGIGIDAGSFLLAAGFFAHIDVPLIRTSRGESVWRELAHGWRGFASRQWLWVVVAAFTFINAAGPGSIGVLGPVFADATIGRTAWGVVLAAQTVGLVLGGLLAIRLRIRRLLRYGMVWMLALALPLVAMATRAPVEVLFAAFLLSGFGIEQFGVAWQTSMHQHVPADLLARVSSYDMLGSILAIPAGQIAAGPVVVAFGITTALITAAVILTGATLAALLSPQVRGLCQPDPNAPAPGRL